MLYLIPPSGKKNELESRREKGIFLGVREQSGEWYIGTAQGVLKAHSTRQLHEDRWNAEQLSAVCGTPWESIPGRPGIEVTTKTTTLTDFVPRFEEPGEDDPQIRRRKIYRKDVKRYKSYPGCPGCQAALRGETARNHTEECRKRLGKAIEENEKERYAKEMERLNKRITARVESKAEESAAKEPETAEPSTEKRNIEPNIVEESDTKRIRTAPSISPGGEEAALPSSSSASSSSRPVRIRDDEGIEADEPNEKRQKMESSGDLLIVGPGQVQNIDDWNRLTQSNPLCVVLPSRSVVIENAIANGSRQVHHLSRIADEYYDNAFRYMRWAEQRGTAVIMPAHRWSEAKESVVKVVNQLSDAHLVSSGDHQSIVSDYRLAQHAYDQDPVEASICFLEEAGDSMWDGDRDLNIIDRTGDCWDDTSGDSLDRDSVIKARLEEIAEVKKHGVYRKVSIEQC